MALVGSFQSSQGFDVEGLREEVDYFDGCQAIGGSQPG
jgi:hypothetical protein